MSYYLNKGNLTSGPIRRHLIRLTLPMMTSLFALISFQLINTFYISRLGTVDLAAISFTFPVTYLVFSLFLGFGIATSSVVSRLIGERRSEDVRRVTSHSLMAVFALSVVLSIAGIIAVEPLFLMLGAGEVLLSRIRIYMDIYFTGMFFICVPIVINAALRASGDARTPAIIMTAAALANAALDPVLIFGYFGFPRMELQGAAISTLIANIGATCAGIFIMKRRGLISAASLTSLKHIKNSLRRLMVIALPAGVTSGLPSIVNSVILAQLAQSGPAAVAAFGVATRVEAFCFIIMMALASGMAPIIGQNYGAGHHSRVRQTIREAIMFCILWSAFVALVLGFGADYFADAFSENSDVRRYTALYFLIVPLSYACSNIANGWASAFNAMGKPQISAALLFLKLILLMIPAVYLGHAVAGPTGIFAAISIVNLVTGIFIHFYGWRNVSRNIVPLSA